MEDARMTLTIRMGNKYINITTCRLSSPVATAGYHYQLIVYVVNCFFYLQRSKHTVDWGLYVIIIHLE